MRRLVPAYALRFGGVAIAALLVAYSAPMAQQEPTKSGKSPIPRAASRDELRPKTEEERRKAEQFDAAQRPLQPGVARTIPAPEVPAVPPGAPRPSYADFVYRFACSGRVIVIGRAEPRRARLNSRESALFTEYELKIDRWIVPSRGPKSIEMSALGGEVMVAGQYFRTNTTRPVTAEARLYVLDPQPRAKTNTLFGFPFPFEAPRSDGVLFLGPHPHELLSGAVSVESFLGDVEAAGGTCEPWSSSDPEYQCSRQLCSCCVEFR